MGLAIAMLIVLFLHTLTFRCYIQVLAGTGVPVWRGTVLPVGRLLRGTVVPLWLQAANRLPLLAPVLHAELVVQHWLKVSQVELVLIREVPVAASPSYPAGVFQMREASTDMPLRQMHVLRDRGV